MLKIGITGGIGSGKTVVSKILESLQFPVFYSDEVAKCIVNNDPDVKKELIEAFGSTIFTHGKLNRSLMAEIIFTDEEARNRVNAIVHPRVRKAFDLFSIQHEGKIIFYEAAILYESGGHKLMDKVILVTAPKELRIQRIMKRDSSTADQTKDRMRTQWSDEEKAKYADFVIVNDEKQPLLTQVEKVLAKIES